MSNNKKEWFATWFDSPYYHTLYKHRDHSEASQFIDKLSSYLQINDSHKILDLACGKGRHAIQLSKSYAEVWGVDLSENSILEAKKSETTNLHFDTHDMREVFKANYFTHVLNLFTSFGYFDDEADNLKMLQSINTMLLEDGILLIDFFNSNKVIKNMIAHEKKVIDGIIFSIDKKNENKKIIKKISFQDKGIAHEYFEQVQLFSKEEIVSMLEQTNFSVLDVFGNYQLEKFDTENSDRLIILAKKK
jgi:ubiquinone/menaquinone biosynthesis C-methylase UbiE